MLLRTLILLISLYAASAVPVAAQVAGSEQRGMDVLQQVLQVSGAAMNPFRAFTANGSITYFWAGQPAQGSATIRARGNDQFRMDANLPDGTRSFVTSRRGGHRRSPDGTLSEIPAHNTMGGTILTIPYPAIAAALTDSMDAVSYAGLAEIGDRQCHKVRVSTIFSPESDPDGTLARLTGIDYFVDAQTGLVIKTEDITHPVQSASEEYLHEVEFENYAAMSGIAVPTVVREKVSGQTIWEFRLSSITFNPNLPDEDFLLQ